VNRPLSQLIYSRVQEGSGSPRIITLHRYNQHARNVKDYALAANPNARIIGLESYKGVFVGRSIVGYTWFVGPQAQPSPIFFGDALAEIERFLGAELPFLLGVEQGAIMALAAAAAVPELLSGVIAVEASLPVVPGWDPPLAPLEGLPVLLLEDPASNAGEGVLSGDELASAFTRWGGSVSRDPVSPGVIPEQSMASWMADNPARHHVTGPSGV
jgi:pimeloyl-ACP methyl ester carboxylesterase